MIKAIRYVVVVSFTVLFFGCSLFPEKAISVNALARTKGMAFYVIEDNLEAVVKKLNKDGEAVVRADYYGSTVYLQIFIIGKKIMLRHYDIDEYSFDEED